LFEVHAERTVLMKSKLQKVIMTKRITYPPNEAAANFRPVIHFLISSEWFLEQCFVFCREPKPSCESYGM